MDKVISSKEILQSKEYKALCERFGILSGGVTKAKITLDIHKLAVIEAEYIPTGSNEKSNSAPEDLLYYSGVIQEYRFNGERIGSEKEFSEGVSRTHVAKSESDARMYLMDNMKEISIASLDRGRGARIEASGIMPSTIEDGAYMEIKTYSYVSLAAIVSVLLQRRKGCAITKPIPPKTNKELVAPDWTAFTKAAKAYTKTKDFAKAMSKFELKERP
jgi:hypothetical protein